MQEWAKANGGPLAFIPLGLAVLFVSVPLGLILIAVGGIGYVLTRRPVRDQLSWWFGGLPDRPPRSEDELARQLERWNQELTSCLKQHGFVHRSKRQSQSDVPDDLQPARDCFYGGRRHDKLMELLRRSDDMGWSTEGEWFDICGGPQTPDQFWRVTGFLKKRFIQPWRDRKGQS